MSADAGRAAIERDIAARVKATFAVTYDMQLGEGAGNVRVAWRDGRSSVDYGDDARTITYTGPQGLVVCERGKCGAAPANFERPVSALIDPGASADLRAAIATPGTSFNHRQVGAWNVDCATIPATGGKGGTNVCVGTNGAVLYFTGFGPKGPMILQAATMSTSVPADRVVPRKR